MISPFTGGPTEKKKEIRTLPFRREQFEVHYQFYLCKDTGEEFTDEDMETANINQVYNQYRVKYGIPVPEEIKRIREQYGLSASKMAAVLGFGTNVYRTYEDGDMPSVSNGRLIQMAKKPEEFKRLLELCEHEFEPEQLEKIHKKIDKLIVQFNPEKNWMEKCMLGELTPTIKNGYKSPVLEKIYQMILFFADASSPFKTKLNKLLFYSDFFHFKRTGFSISGLTYRAIQNGPVPDNYDLIFNDCVQKNIVKIKYQDHGNYTGEQFFPASGTSFNAAIFSGDELTAMKTVSQFFKTYTAKEIADTSHEETAWKENKYGHGIIDYTYGFDLKFPIADDISLTHSAD